MYGSGYGDGEKEILEAPKSSTSFDGNHNGKRMRFDCVKSSLKAVVGLSAIRQHVSSLLQRTCLVRVWCRSYVREDTTPAATTSSCWIDEVINLDLPTSCIHYPYELSVHRGIDITAVVMTGYTRRKDCNGRPLCMTSAPYSYIRSSLPNHLINLYQFHS